MQALSTAPAMRIRIGGNKLVQPTIDAVKQWRYQPSLLNGQAVEVDTEVDVVFSLRN